ncbi:MULTISPECIES: carbohydrate ABC transporter permease [Arthrobacter]|uniref:Sugar ABC transporter permease n=1 Tax=Arthrobacter sunyaminii TaxID=2816859 RepID=A0A975S6F2_9MICC|nr:MULTISPECIES: sugar ABC transporter permease [Arthrobacter]MBO0909891.1 sugar ABC transporter permease [Arthrobacter sunyaminii]QWQ36676.1 sugar ABC transporter permease [Arthrobacter sunyaminii]
MSSTSLAGRSRPVSGRPDARRARPPSARRQLGRLLPLLPAVALLLVFLGGPILWAFYGSFTDAGLTGASAKNPEWIGFENYRTLFTDPLFPRSLWLTFLFVFASAVIGQNCLGLALALVMQRANKAVAGFVGSCVVAAWVLPEIVAAFIAYAFFFRDGMLNQMTGLLGIPAVDWLYEYPMAALILANIWRGTAFSMMNYQAALNDVPPDITESATIDGAGGLARLRFITLPMIKRSIATNLMLITLLTLGTFTLIYVVTQGGPLNASTTLPIMAYEQAFQYGDIGYGTAIAVVMLLIGAVFSIAYIRMLRERKE